MGVVEEVVVPFPETLVPLASVRSTLLVASISTLKQAGLGDRYFAVLPAEHHRSLRDLAAGVWVPVRIAEAHYGACDALHLEPHEILALGNNVATLTAQVFMRLVLRTAREGGATPWIVLGNSERYWGRYYQGSGVALTKLGPKEARLEVRASSLAAYAYWRTAFRAILGALLAPFCSKGYVKELKPPSPSGALYRLAWA